jgi:hypothetical protein
MKLGTVELDSSFILVTQAAGAKVELLGFAIHRHRCGMDISDPAPVSMAFGMTDVRTVNRDFTANIALQFVMSPLCV